MAETKETPPRMGRIAKPFGGSYLASFLSWKLLGSSRESNQFFEIYSDISTSSIASGRASAIAFPAVDYHKLCSCQVGHQYKAMGTVAGGCDPAWWRSKFKQAVVVLTIGFFSIQCTGAASGGGFTPYPGETFMSK